MDAGTVLSIVISVISIIVGLAGVAGYLRGTAAKSRIEALQGDISDWKNRYEGLVADNENNKRLLKDANSKLEVAEAKIAALDKALSGKEEFQEIADILRTHDERAKNIEKIVIETAKKTGLEV